MEAKSQNVFTRGRLHLLLEEPAPDDRDWYGNVTLHHAVVRDKIDIAEIKLLLEKYPEGAAVRNQFGCALLCHSDMYLIIFIRRIPLHGALDRSPGVCDGDVIQLLVTAYPAGVDAKDEDGITPLDIAVHWDYPPAVLKPMLLVFPNQYRGLYFKVIFGKTIGSVINAADAFVRSIRRMKSGAPISASEELSPEIGYTAPPTRDEEDSVRIAAGPESNDLIPLNGSDDLLIRSNETTCIGDGDETLKDGMSSMKRCDSRLSVESFHSIMSAVETPRELF
jgi:hypothetical protein